MALLQAEEQRRQALVEAAALEASRLRARTLCRHPAGVPFLLRRTVPMCGIGIAWGAQYTGAAPAAGAGLPPWALWWRGSLDRSPAWSCSSSAAERSHARLVRCFAGKRRQWCGWAASASPPPCCS